MLIVRYSFFLWNSFSLERQPNESAVIVGYEPTVALSGALSLSDRPRIRAQSAGDQTLPRLVKIPSPLNTSLSYFTAARTQAFQPTLNS
ncbi:hypothetical protein NPIL_193001 [Nephila pilipes]|uniref:Uncharacterized protein n=1 Tax=Nephila pilipes TaxID=299642 RepID=A0A8X6MTJ9_NEPPI|nr:hypothetical protein NPIL_193001 [Nephila pilipes]